MSPSEVLTKHTSLELQEWQAWFKLKAADDEKANATSNRQSGRKGQGQGTLMAIRVTHQITGIEDLNKKLGRIEKAFRDKVLGEALEDAAEPVLKQVVKDVPVDEGVLRDSYTIDEPETNNRGEGSIRVFASQRKDGYHAHLVEFGTSQHRAQPHLRPSLTKTRRKQRDAFINRQSTKANVVGRG